MIIFYLKPKARNCLQKIIIILRDIEKGRHNKPPENDANFTDIYLTWRYDPNVLKCFKWLSAHVCCFSTWKGYLQCESCHVFMLRLWVTWCRGHDVHGNGLKMVCKSPCYSCMCGNNHHEDQCPMTERMRMSKWEWNEERVFGAICIALT